MLIKNLTYRQLECFKTIADEQLGGPFAKGRDKMVRDLISDSTFSLTTAHNPYNSGVHPFLIYNTDTKNLDIYHATIKVITHNGMNITRIIFENGDIYDDVDYIIDILAIVI